MTATDLNAEFANIYNNPFSLISPVTSDVSWNDNVNATFGDSGDADIRYNGTDLLILPAVVGTGDMRISGGSLRTQDNEGVWFGTGDDARIYYDGTHLIINPAIVGTGNVGIGTTTPEAKLDIANGAMTLLLGADSAANTRTNVTQKLSRIGGYHYTNAEEPVGVVLAESTATENIVSFGGSSSSFNAATSLHFFTAANTTTTAGTNRMMINTSGNVGIGTTTFGAAAVRVLTLGNGTAPGALAATASIVALAGEMWAYDSGGIGSQLSSHPKEVMDVADPLLDPFPFGFKAVNPYLPNKGKAIIDWGALIRAVEALSGKQFATYSDLPLEARRDWDMDQEEHRVNREVEVTVAQNQIAGLDRQIAAEADLKKKADLTRQRDAIKIPLPHTKNRPPKWMVDRGVKTAL